MSLLVPGATLQLVAEAFAPPTLADQFFQPGVLSRPNPDLKPERVRNDWQAQLTSNTLRLGRATVSGSVSLFRADVDGMILWFPNFLFVWSPTNYDVRRRGAELSAAVNLPVADLSLTGSVSNVAVSIADRCSRDRWRTGRGTPRMPHWLHRDSGSAAAALSLHRATADGCRERAQFPGSIRRDRPAIGSAHPGVQPSVELAVGVDDIWDTAGSMLPDYPSPGRTWRLTLSVRRRGAGTQDGSPTP